MEQVERGGGVFGGGEKVGGGVGASVGAGGRNMWGQVWSQVAGEGRCGWVRTECVVTAHYDQE